MEERLKNIEEKLESISKSLESVSKEANNKWKLPVSLAVLGTCLGILNYCVERNVDKSLINETVKRQIYAEFEANSKRDFYKEAKGQVNGLHELFEEFCQFDDRQDTENELDSAALKFRLFYENQSFVDPRIINSMKDYSDYITDITYYISGGVINKDGIDSAKVNSQLLYEGVIKNLNEGLNKLTH